MKIKYLSIVIFSLLATSCAHKVQNKDKNKNNHYADIKEMPIDQLQTEQQISTKKDIKPDLYSSNKEAPFVVRSGRYLLISSVPGFGQKHILEQIVNVKIPTGKYTKTVREGMETTLKNSGITLCFSTNKDVMTMLSRPLPKPHYKFGPMMLYHALQMLSGEAFKLQYDYVARTACFEPRALNEVYLSPHGSNSTYYQDANEYDQIKYNSYIKKRY